MKTKATSRPSPEREEVVMKAFMEKIKELERGTSPQRLKVRDEYLAMKERASR